MVSKSCSVFLASNLAYSNFSIKIFFSLSNFIKSFLMVSCLFFHFFFFSFSYFMSPSSFFRLSDSSFFNSVFCASHYFFLWFRLTENSYYNWALSTSHCFKSLVIFSLFSFIVEDSLISNYWISLESSSFFNLVLFMVWVIMFFSWIIFSATSLLILSFYLINTFFK